MHFIIIPQKVGGCKTEGGVVEGMHAGKIGEIVV